MKMKLLLLSVFAFTLLSYDIPKGWYRWGFSANKYEMGVDIGSGRNGSDAATIKSNKRDVYGFGSLAQTIMADKYLTKRVRLSAYVRSEDIDGWAGVWMRIDGKSASADSNRKTNILNNYGPTLAFDNMHDRPITGTTNWIKYDVILDVPGNANKITYGVLLSGAGQVWFDDISLDIVDKTVSTTEQATEPSNLNFDK
jgi:hypothetical protein